jgi:hypothetical protein
MQWRILKQFPQLFGDTPYEALTMHQQQWLQMQYLLDEGAEVCPTCEAVGAGTYCRQCGAALRAGPTVRACPSCHVPGPGPYCSHCGAAVSSPDLEALEAGTFDWEAWQQDLAPVLQRLTAVNTPERSPWNG